MPKLLTRLKITEVSAVDRAAGDGTKILLMKRDDDRPRSKPHVERHARRLRKFQEVFDSPDPKRGRSFNDIMKAKADHDANDDPIRPPAATHCASTAADLLVESGRFPHRTAALDHLLNTTRGAALLQRMSKKETTPMDTVYDIMKAGSIAGFCAAVVAKRRTSISQDDLVSAVGKVARELRWPELSEAQAYAKVDADPIEGPVLRQAVNVTKASLAETMLGPGLPVTVVGTPAAMLDAVGNDQSEVEQARAELMRIGRKQYPRSSENEVFERAFSDPRNATLVARLYQRPTPTSIYPLPNEWLRSDGTQHAKSDRRSAYGDLMEKAEEYRNAHPELSVAQAFSKVYTDRANVELAKRERVESAPR
jgi:hypothetical protein